MWDDLNVLIYFVYLGVTLLSSEGSEYALGLLLQFILWRSWFLGNVAVLPEISGELL